MRVHMLFLVGLVAALPVAASAQHDMMSHDMAPPIAAPSSGQAAFAAIGDVVRALEADSTTDWTKVDIEALRAHLIDMDNVTLRAAVTQSNIPGGVSLNITGTGTTVPSIQRMLSMHAMMLEMGDQYHASAVAIPNGIRLVVTARNADDSRQVTRIRALGFAGLLVEGDHHAMHHMALARGEMHGG
ncbi:MAG: hypothetical protein ABI205_03685, partial [Gemmatimonadaceae bacterium]